MSRQLRNLYTQLPNSTIKLILHPTSPNDINRLGVYGVKLRQAHLTEIAAIAKRQQAIEQLTTQLSSDISSLSNTKQKLTQDRALLIKNRRERRQTLTTIESKHRDAAARRDAITAELAALSELLQRLTPVVFDAQLRPFKSLRGKLSMPVNGRIITAYGTTREGKLKWQGQRIAANASTDVRVVADGQVVFADWLRGQGLVTIVDHGDGYLSLYGNNEVSYAEEGQWVASGEVIGRLSAIQQDATLYFELRKNGKPFNPRTWYRR